MENDAVVLSVSLFRKHIGCGYQGGVRAAGRGRWRPGEINWHRSPDQLRDIRGGVRVVPDVAALIRAPRKCRCCYPEDDFENSLDAVREAAAGPIEGIFGPDSLTWRVDREAAIFLGAGRALLLQLAHPWVAAAISEHSRTFADPVGRFHRTFNITFTMVFGTLDQALAASRRLHRRHAAVTGILPQAAGRFEAGSAYSANEVSALRWVHATLVETALQTHDLVLPVLTNSEREQYWAEAKLYAALFGIRPADLPADWTSFAAYTEAMAQSDSLAVSPAARDIAEQIFSGRGTGLRVPRWYRALTAHLLPERLA